MEFLFFTDTETNGLFPKKQRGQAQIKADDPAAPYVASIAWQLCEASSGKICGLGLHYIKPDGWTMPQGEGSAGAANGLTDELLHAIGVPAVAVAAQLSAILSKGVILVAHGATFDAKMIRGFLRRNGFPDHYEKTRTFCTQMTNIGVCKLKQAGSNRPKTPKLAEAFAHWFPEEQMPAAHAAWNDVLSLKRLYNRMAKANMDMTPRTPVSSAADGDDDLDKALDGIGAPPSSNSPTAPAPTVAHELPENPTLF